MKLAPTLQRMLADPDDHRPGDDERMATEVRALLAVARAAKKATERHWPWPEDRTLERAFARLERVSRKP